MHKFTRRFDFIVFCLLLGSVIALGGFAPGRMLLQQAQLNPVPIAPIAVSDPERSFRDLERALYGKFTPPTAFKLQSRKTLTADWLEKRALVEQRIYSVSHGQTPQSVEIVIVTPRTKPDAPLIISQNFAPNVSVISKNGMSPLSEESRSGGPLETILSLLFGRHIIEPPLQDILSRGYGFVALHPPTYIADDSFRGNQQLNAIFGDDVNRPGALTVWASLSTALAESLKAENPERPLVAYGHSRYGKSALLAAAHSPAIDGVIAHQSGTAGASLIRDTTGESLENITRAYPHWLKPSAAQYAKTPKSLPSDAHVLLAVISPKPIFLGNARRDVWSDPEGAFQAAQWAAGNSPQTFSARRLDDFRPSDDIVFWTRPGTHGVVKEDWPAFLEFMDSHFK